jgi:hypothetical protein
MSSLKSYLIMLIVEPFVILQGNKIFNFGLAWEGTISNEREPKNVWAEFSTLS